MTKPNSREDAIYLSLWRMAANNSPPTIPPFLTESAAITVRAKLYRVIKPYRSGKIDDPDLLLAAEKYAVNVKGKTITFDQKITKTISEQLFISLGLTNRDLMTQEEKDSDDRMNALMEGLK